MSIQPIWILGEADNDATRNLVVYLKDRFPGRDVFVLALKPSFKNDLKRLKRKVQNAGFSATIARVKQIFLNRYLSIFRGAATSVTNNSERHRNKMTPSDIFYFKSLRSQEIIHFVENSDIKYLLAFTDHIIPSRLIRALPQGIWNAHPGAVPKYRGLGSTDAMLADGFFPLVSLHMIDEGVDTGPLLFEVHPDFQHCKNINDIYNLMFVTQMQALGDLVSLMDQESDLKFRDDFFQPSNISHRNALLTRKVVSKICDTGSLRKYSRALNRM